MMEQQQDNLNNMLENTPDISLVKKCSILQDVARGLLFSPAIIHKDLTTTNVLINSEIVTKIAGNSRIVDIQPGQLAMQDHDSGCTRHNCIHAPRGFRSPTQVWALLDMFSFGHLTLFTAIQEFPGNLLSPTYQHPTTGRLTP